MDLNLFRSINLGWHNHFCDYLFALLTYSGLGAAAAIVALILVCKKGTRLYAFAIGLSAFLGGTMIAQTFKTLIPRERPSNLSFAIVQEPILHSSFPSGHTATAFAIATALAIYALRQGRWGLVALSYLWALGVGISRVYRGVHWPSDVLGGALGGIVGGCLAILILDAIVKQPKSTEG